VVCGDFLCVAYHHKVLLYQHLKTHLMEVVKRCAGCKLDFTNPGQFKMHVQNCEKITTYTCKFCAASRKSQGELDIHIRRVHTKDYVKSECYFCRKKFETSYLTRHVRKHTKEKPWKCRYCGAESQNSAALKLHIQRIHFPVLKSGKIYSYHRIIVCENNQHKLNLKEKQIN